MLHDIDINFDIDINRTVLINAGGRVECYVCAHIINHEGVDRRSTMAFIIILIIIFLE